MAGDVERMFLYPVNQKDNTSQTEAFANLDIVLPNRKGIHELKVKMDPGAEGNTVPLHTFRQMFPKYMDQNGHPGSGTTNKETAILTAYNGSDIPQHGSSNIKCGYKSLWKAIKFYVVKWTYHIRIILHPKFEIGNTTLLHTENSMYPS